MKGALKENRHILLIVDLNFTKSRKKALVRRSILGGNFDNKKDVANYFSFAPAIKGLLRCYFRDLMTLLSDKTFTKQQDARNGSW